ncbi:uncharacterized protein [Littorina saxatilis]|uniref:uncharacterized protein n=1 Tax=Littorina saxatilis TaxID=31220 RepID=UPI0038B59F6E
MKGDERVISDWVVSLNSVITTASADKDITQHTDSETERERETDTDSATAEGEDAGTAPHRSRQLSEDPEVIKKGWLNILTDPTPGEDKLDNMQTEYCVLQRQGDRYRLDVYKGKRDWRRYDRNSNSCTYWTGNVATVCLDTARHAQLVSTHVTSWFSEHGREIIY